MIVISLVIVCALFLFVNYYISDGDLLNPTFLFCGMNFVSAVFCTIACNLYGLALHFNTFCVLTFGLLVFTVVNYVCRFQKQTQSGIISAAKEKQIDIRRLIYMPIYKWYLGLFIFFEVLVLFFAIKYVNDIARAYGQYGTLTQNIGTYNKLAKSSSYNLSDLGVHSNSIYSWGYPMSIAVSTVLFSVAACNYRLGYKFEKMTLLSCFLVLVISVITGSRSSAFKFALGWLMVWMIVSRMAEGSYKKGNWKLLSRMIVIGFIIIGLFFLLKTLLGRSKRFGIFEYLAAYIGVPLINLDIFLSQSFELSELWGQETFRNLYAFIGGYFDISDYIYKLNLPYNYHNGIYLGNVYTMYYMFIEDFGYWGVLPLTLIAAYFYNSLYVNLMSFSRRTSLLGVQLFVYAYMFDSVFLLTFSNRFYEGILQTNFLKYFICVWLFWFVFKHIRLRLGKKRIF